MIANAVATAYAKRLRHGGGLETRIIETITLVRAALRLPRLNHDDTNKRQRYLPKYTCKSDRYHPIENNGSFWSPI